MTKRAEGASVKFDGLSFRLNEKERRIITKNAEKAGLSPSLYAKKQALEGKLKIMFSDAKAKEIITNLARIGNNVNQIAKKINTEQVADDIIKSQFTQIQSDLDIIMDFFILGKKPPKSPTTEMKKEMTSEILPQEIDIFSSSPENKKCCNYCGAELIKTEDAHTHQPLWMCAEYYKIVKNQDLLNTTSTEELKKHTVIEAV